MGSGLEDKLITLQEAVRLVKDGDSIVCPSFGYEKVSFAFIRELIRQKKRNLYLYGSGMNVDADLLIGAGCVRKAEIGYIGFENIGLAPAFRRMVEKGKLEVEDYSNFIMAMRFIAGALNISYIPVRSGLGSDILKCADKKHIREIRCPFTGEKFLAVRAVHPDFAVLHVQKADTEGNISAEGPLYDNVEKARSAKIVIVTVEEIIEPFSTRAHPEYTILPSFYVDYIIEAPFGAHPYACYKYYDYDWEHIEDYAEKARSEEKFQEYLKEFIFSVEDNWSYLKKVGMEKIMKLRANTSLGYSTYYLRKAGVKGL